MDPLTAFRQYIIDNHRDRITRSGDEFRFGDDYIFPANVQTAYRAKNGAFYTLESLVHFVANLDLQHNMYFSSARNLGISGVSMPDRKDLLDYLTGKTQTSDSIDPSAKVVFPTLRDLNAAPAGEPENPTEDPVDPMEWIRSVERPLKDRTQILLCKNRDFYSILTSAARREEERRSADSLQRKDNLVAKSRIERGGDDIGLGFDGNQKQKLHMKGVPIILVPSASATLITIYNVKEFLEDGVFIPTAVKQAQMSVKPECVTVQKKFSRDVAVTAYEVRDKPSSLKPEDWERVVAVFVLGKEWQFKDWPQQFKDHVQIFNKVMGFYLRFEDDSVESAKTAKQWNVKIISISKNKRHQDRAAALEVWDRLEEFMRSRTR